MSEVIVRMEKFPTKCFDCKMWPICEALNKAMDDDKDLFASRLFRKTEDGFTKPADCPIIGELPEQHGDLVDADTVLWGEEVPDSEGIVVPVTIGDVIEGYDVQIVIAAERKDDGEQ